MSTKVVYLLGVSGSGKGYVANGLSEHQLIEINLFRHQVLGPIAALLKGQHKNQWEIWRALTPRFDIVPEVTRQLKEVLVGHEPGKPIVVEGELLAYSPFFEAFNTAIETCIESGVESKRVWLNPSAEQVHTNKTKHRARKSERNTTIDRVKRLLDWYQSEMESQTVDLQFNEADTAISELNTFLA
jgi:hypothetical protein